jgi:hypothetical protein
MGGSASSSQGGTQAVDQTREVTLAPLSARGEELRQRLGSLSGDQVQMLRSALSRIRAGSAGTLLPSDRAQVTEAYDQARTRYGQDTTAATQFLGGGRGEALSDAPLSPQALRQVALGLGDLNSAEAQARLGYGLKTNDARAQAITSLGQAMPGATSALSMRDLAERLASSTVRERGTGPSTSSGSWTPANFGLDTGMKLAGGIGGLALAGSNAWNNWNTPAPSSVNTSWTGNVASPLR